MERYTTTLTALLSPRRILPVALVAVALVTVQVIYSGSLLSGVVPAGMASGFVLLGPWGWRALVAHSRRRVIGSLLYLGEAVALVILCGISLPALLELGPTFLTDLGSLFVAVVLFLVGGWGLGRDIELELSLEHSRLKAIRTHLDPHFLYNTLNAIAEWCAEDPRVAEEATLRLASMLRDVLEGLERRSWPLERELSVVEALLELHRIRDAEAFSVSLVIEETGVTEVPPLLLVTLAENAVKHGPRKGHHGPIQVRVSEDGPALRVEVENPGPFRPDRAAGRGLNMMRSQLALSYGGRARFDIHQTGERTCARLVLPRRAA
ncbi:MAG: histidine kinase [Myxococcaceae bacterium]